MNNGSSLIPTIAGITATGGTAATIAAASHGIGIASISAGGATITTIAVAPIVATVAVPLAVAGGVLALGYWIFKD